MTFAATFLSIEGSVLDWIVEHYPGLLGTIIAVVAAVYGTKWYIKFMIRFKSTEKQCNDLRNLHIPDLHNKATKIDQKLTSVLNTVTKISTYLITKGGVESGLFAGNSPLELTPIGEKILIDIGGKKYVDENLTILLEMIASKQPKTGLDVQNYSNGVLTEGTTDDKFSGIKNYIYNNPIYKSDDKQVNLDIGTVIQIMGIYLRNKYFEKHPALKADL